ncbi:hypothetical protein [Reyranella sp.]|uniref:hypothetical protein n=1 Tax=Reyranella sp. TaxID=1929291 RepID=UPI003BA88C9F
MIRLFGLASLGLALTLATGASAEVYCKSVGVPKGCVVRPGTDVGAPGVGVRPGVGAGAPGVGVTPGAGAGAPGPGVAPGNGPNRGGPVDRAGRR